MKDEAAGVATEEFVRLKPKMYSFLVDDSNEHKNEQKKVCEEKGGCKNQEVHTILYQKS